MQTEGLPDRVLVGAVARAHGIRGEVLVDAWSEVPQRFAPGSRLMAVLVDGAVREVTVASARRANNRLLVRFEGIATRADAQALHGASLAIAREAVAPLAPGRYYRFELVGLEARTPTGRALGRVVDVYDSGANDILTIEGPAGEVLVPVAPGVLVSIDVEAGVIVVDPPPGLPGLAEE